MPVPKRSDGTQRRPAGAATAASDDTGLTPVSSLAGRANTLVHLQSLTPALGLPHSAVMDQPADTPTFEASLRELETIVAKLESGDTPLEDAIQLYERGNALRAQCAERLDAAQARIEAIRLDAEGGATTTPFAAG